VTRLANHQQQRLQTLDSRRSVSSRQLSGPGPNRDELLRILQSAVRVPDHGKRVPFRFLRIEGDARHALGDILARRSRERDPSASDSVIEKDRLRFTFAPVVVAVIAKQGPDEKIPAQERLLTAGCVCFALLQAAQAMDFGAQWLTGWAAYDPVIRDILGVREDEVVAGFVHIGTVLLEAPERERPDPAALLDDWTPAA
jgi:nitroreductase